VASLIFSNSLIFDQKKEAKMDHLQVKTYSYTGLVFNGPPSVDPGDTASPGSRYIPV